MKDLKITVVGAGIGGLAAARALALKGAAVRVLEQADKIAEVGAGIQISPNGMAVIDGLGCGDDVRARSIKAQAVRLTDGRDGRDVLTLDIARHAADLDWHFIHRAALINILLDGARDAGVNIELGTQVDPPPEGQALPGDDLLVGADGAKSAMRAKVDEATKPFFTGQVAWRAVIDDPAPPEAVVLMGPGRHLVTYPLTDGRRNIVAVEERKAWADEGWNHEDHPANLRAAFAGFSDEAQGWLAKVETVHLWGLFRHRVADRWFTGHQAILGDAAHPTLPFLAQGANMALEDAWVLAESLAAGTLRDGLGAYQAARIPRVTRVIEAANGNARNYHLKFPPLRFAAHAALRIAGQVAPSAPLRKFDWLYRFDVTKG